MKYIIVICVLALTIHSIYASSSSSAVVAAANAAKLSHVAKKAHTNILGARPALSAVGTGVTNSTSSATMPMRLPNDQTAQHANKKEQALVTEEQSRTSRSIFYKYFKHFNKGNVDAPLDLFTHYLIPAAGRHLTIPFLHNEVPWHESDMQSVCWHPKERKFILAVVGAIRVLGTNDMRILLFPDPNDPRNKHVIQTAMWSADGSRIIAASDRGLKIWDSTSEEHLFDRSVPLDSSVRSVTISADSSTVAFATLNTIDLYNLQNYTHLLCIPIILQNWASIQAIALSYNGNSVAVAINHADTETFKQQAIIKIFNQKGEELSHFKIHDRYVWAIAWNYRENQLLTGSYDRTAKIWNLKGILLRTLQGHDDGVLAVAWSHDYSKIATIGEDRTAKIWDAASGKLLCTLQGYGEHQSSVVSIAWSADDTEVATVSKDYRSGMQAARVWQLPWDDKQFNDFCYGNLTLSQSMFLWLLKDHIGQRNVKLSKKMMHALETFHPLIKENIIKLYDINVQQMPINYEHIWVPFIKKQKKLKNGQSISLREIVHDEQLKHSISIKDFLKNLLSIPDSDRDCFVLAHYNIKDFKEFLELACKKFPKEFFRRYDGSYACISSYVEDQKYAYIGTRGQHHSNCNYAHGNIESYNLDKMSTEQRALWSLIHDEWNVMQFVLDRLRHISQCDLYYRVEDNSLDEVLRVITRLRITKLKQGMYLQDILFKHGISAVQFMRVFNTFDPQWQQALIEDHSIRDIEDVCKIVKEKSLKESLPAAQSSSSSSSSSSARAKK